MTAAPPVFDRLAAWVQAMTLESVPPEVTRTAKRALRDFLAASLAGGGERVVTVLTEHALRYGRPGGASIMGTSQRVAPEDAALVNSARGHALDFDDMSPALAGHPTVVIFPAALATAEEVAASGRSLLEAYVLGIEAAARIGRLASPQHTERGWHPTATLGAFGSAVATARLLGCDAEQVSTALAITASMSSGIKGSFGADTKSLQVARAAQNGMQAARLAAMGLTANRDAWERAQGYARTYHPGPSGAPPGADDLDELAWQMLDPGLVFKLYPCCASTHGAIDASVRLRARLGRPAQVRAVRVRTHPQGLAYTDRPEPATPDQARFSLQFVVALGLLHGAVGLGDFEPDRLEDSEVVGLMRRVAVEAWDGPDVPRFGGEVRVETEAGEAREHVRIPRGSEARNPAADEALMGKLRDCVRWGGYPEELADLIDEAVTALARQQSVEPLSALLRTPAGAPTM